MQLAEAQRLGILSITSLTSRCRQEILASLTTFKGFDTRYTCQRRRTEIAIPAY